MRGRRQSTHHTHVREGSYIKKLIKQINPACRIQVKSVQILTSLIRDTTIRIMNEAFHLVQLKNRRTLNARDVQTSVRLCTVGEISRHAVSEGVKRVTNISSAKQFPPSQPPAAKTATTTTPSSPSSNPATPISHPPVIPLSYLKTKVKQMNYNYRISNTSMHYLSAVIEYLLCEVLELSINAAIFCKRTLIQPRDIFLAIANDDELDKMYGDVIIPGGGTKPLLDSLSYFR
ncbi:hypothetical protein ACTFIY_011856 [Dictyostelium cf. discoideum]